MALTLKVQHPHIEEGTELGVAGAFVVKNGESVELTPENEREFIALRGMTVEEALGDNEMYELSGTPEFKSIEDVLLPEQVEAIRNTDPASVGLRTETEEEETQPEQPTNEGNTTNENNDTDDNDEGGGQ